MGPSASNVSILHTVSRHLQASIAAKPGNGCSGWCENIAGMIAFEATDLVAAHVAPVLCQDLLADALSAAESSDDRCKRWL